MKKMTYLLLMISCFSCCKKNITQSVTTSSSINDTILYTDSINLYKRIPKRLTASIAKIVLENYYRPKGLYPEEALSLDSLLSSNTDETLRCFKFFDLRKINIKNRRYPLAIVRYYKCDCFENGNHVRPHAAMITANENGDYILVNEDFLPDYYYINNIYNEDMNLRINDSILDRANPPSAIPYKAQIILK